MASIYNVIYNVETKTKTDGGLDKIIQLIEKMGGQIEAINTKKIKPSGDTTGIDNVSKKLQEQDGIFKSLVKTAGVYLGFSVLKEGLTSIVQTGAAYEGMQLRLNNLMGSAEAGKAVFAQLQEDAVKSPFDLDLLVNANSGLISAGVSAKDARKDIEGLANAVAFAGKGNAEFDRMAQNLQQIKNVGKASAMDIKQFAQAGISIYPALAKSMGVPVEKLKDMEIGYEDLTKALNLASQEGGLFAGGIASLLGSTGVKISNTMDSLKNTMFVIFEAIKPGINFLLDKFQDLMAFITKTVKFLQQNETIAMVLATTFGILATAIAAFSLQSKLASIWSGITTTALIVQNLATGNLTVAMTLAGLAGTGMWIAVTGGLILAVAGFVVLYKNIDKVKLILRGLGSAFGKVWSNLKEGFMGIGNYFKKIFNPIFEAIDNFKKGKYKEAGKNILELGVNLSPGKIAFDVTKKLAQGTTEAYNKGSKDLLKYRVKEKIEDKVAPKTPSSATKIAGEMKGSLSSSAQGATSSVKNVTINLEALQKIHEQHINNKSDSKKILKDMNSGLIEILNNTNQVK